MKKVWSFVINLTYNKNLFLFLIFFCSCQDTDRKKITFLIKEWVGREIVFPSNLVSVTQGKDSLMYLESNVDYKVVNYIDSLGCTSCKLGLSRWKDFINEVDSLNYKNVLFLFYFFPKNKSELHFILRRDSFNYPVYIDEQDAFNKLNHLPLDVNFQTFLLDKNNKILAIGNPIHNPKVKELYMNIIQGNATTKEKEVAQTEAQVKESTISLGHFNWQEKQKVHFTIYNVGKRPLVINDVSTSCGCTSVDYPTQPVRPNDSISLRVIYKADNPEHFNKTLTVYCNTESSPLILKIMGDAE